MDLNTLSLLGAGLSQVGKVGLNPLKILNTPLVNAVSVADPTKRLTQFSAGRQALLGAQHKMGTDKLAGGTPPQRPSGSGAAALATHGTPAVISGLYGALSSPSDEMIGGGLGGLAGGGLGSFAASKLLSMLMRGRGGNAANLIGSSVGGALGGVGGMQAGRAIERYVRNRNAMPSYDEGMYAEASEKTAGFGDLADRAFSFLRRRAPQAPLVSQVAPGGPMGMHKKVWHHPALAYGAAAGGIGLGLAGIAGGINHLSRLADTVNRSRAFKAMQESYGTDLTALLDQSLEKKLQSEAGNEVDRERMRGYLGPMLQRRAKDAFNALYRISPDIAKNPMMAAEFVEQAIGSQIGAMTSPDKDKNVFVPARSLAELQNPSSLQKLVDTRRPFELGNLALGKTLPTGDAYKAIMGRP